MKMKRRTMRSEVPVMAMGDIAFILLIFFVILAKASDDSHLQWKPAEAPKLDAPKHTRVSVLVDVDKKIYLNGHPIGLGQLSRAIEEYLEGHPAGERMVLLKIHNETTAVTFEPIFEAVSEAGGELMHVLEEKREP